MSISESRKSSQETSRGKKEIIWFPRPALTSPLQCSSSSCSRSHSPSQKKVEVRERSPRPSSSEIVAPSKVQTEEEDGRQRLVSSARSTEKEKRERKTSKKNREDSTPYVSSVSSCHSSSTHRHRGHYSPKRTAAVAPQPLPEKTSRKLTPTTAHATRAHAVAKATATATAAREAQRRDDEEWAQLHAQLDDLHRQVSCDIDVLHRKVEKDEKEWKSMGKTSPSSERPPLQGIPSTPSSHGHHHHNQSGSRENSHGSRGKEGRGDTKSLEVLYDVRSGAREQLEALQMSVLALERATRQVKKMKANRRKREIELEEERRELQREAKRAGKRESAVILTQAQQLLEVEAEERELRRQLREDGRENAKKLLQLQTMMLGLRQELQEAEYTNGLTEETDAYEWVLALRRTEENLHHFHQEMTNREEHLAIGAQRQIEASDQAWKHSMHRATREEERQRKKRMCRLYDEASTSSGSSSSRSSSRSHRDGKRRKTRKKHHRKGKAQTPMDGLSLVPPGIGVAGCPPPAAYPAMPPSPFFLPPPMCSPAGGPYFSSPQPPTAGWYPALGASLPLNGNGSFSRVGAGVASTMGAPAPGIPGTYEVGSMGRSREHRLQESSGTCRGKKGGGGGRKRVGSCRSPRGSLSSSSSLEASSVSITYTAPSTACSTVYSSHSSDEGIDCYSISCDSSSSLLSLSARIDRLEQQGRRIRGSHKRAASPLSYPHPSSRGRRHSRRELHATRERREQRREKRRAKKHTHPDRRQRNREGSTTVTTTTRTPKPKVHVPPAVQLPLDPHVSPVAWPLVYAAEPIAIPAGEARMAVYPDGGGPAWHGLPSRWEKNEDGNVPSFPLAPPTPPPRHARPSPSLLPPLKGTPQGGQEVRLEEQKGGGGGTGALHLQPLHPYLDPPPRSPPPQIVELPFLSSSSPGVAAVAEDSWEGGRAGKRVKKEETLSCHSSSSTAAAAADTMAAAAVSTPATFHPSSQLGHRLFAASPPSCLPTSLPILPGVSPERPPTCTMDTTPVDPYRFPSEALFCPPPPPLQSHLHPTATPSWEHKTGLPVGEGGMGGGPPKTEVHRMTSVENTALGGAGGGVPCRKTSAIPATRTGPPLPPGPNSGLLSSVISFPSSLPFEYHAGMTLSGRKNVEKKENALRQCLWNLTHGAEDVETATYVQGPPGYTYYYSAPKVFTPSKGDPLSPTTRLYTPKGKDKENEAVPLSPGVGAVTNADELEAYLHQAWKRGEEKKTTSKRAMKEAREVVKLESVRPPRSPLTSVTPRPTSRRHSRHHSHTSHSGRRSTMDSHFPSSRKASSHGRSSSAKHSRPASGVASSPPRDGSLFPEEDQVMEMAAVLREISEAQAQLQALKRQREDAEQTTSNTLEAVQMERAHFYDLLQKENEAQQKEKKKRHLRSPLLRRLRRPPSSPRSSSRKSEGIEPDEEAEQSFLASTSEPGTPVKME